MVLPAHAGVILEYEIWKNVTGCITRTCGGDPQIPLKLFIFSPVLPAHAGVILGSLFQGAGFDGITRTCGGDPA